MAGCARRIRHIRTVCTTEYIEYYRVCPFVCIGYPHPLHRKRVCRSPQDPSAEGGWGEPIETKGQTLQYSFLILIYIVAD
jgi:hypothetical protein